MLDKIQTWICLQGRKSKILLIFLFIQSQRVSSDMDYICWSGRLIFSTGWTGNCFTDAAIDLFQLFKTWSADWVATSHDYRLVSRSSYLTQKKSYLNVKKLWPEETEQKDSLPEHIGHEKIAFSDDEPADVQVVVHGVCEFISRIGGIAGKVIASDWVSSMKSA